MYYIWREDGMTLCHKGSSADLGFFPAGMYAAAMFSLQAAALHTVSASNEPRRYAVLAGQPPPHAASIGGGAMDWQSMATAPQDGTYILAVNAANNPNRMFVVHYSEKYGGPWVTDEAPMSWVNGLTHWMPLPSLPNAA